MRGGRGGAKMPIDHEKKVIIASLLTFLGFVYTMYTPHMHVSSMTKSFFFLDFQIVLRQATYKYSRIIH